MDSVASAMLYANGAFSQAVGRNLAIVDTGSGVQTPSTSAAPSGPSAWAVGEVESAIAAGLVPQDMQNGYQAPISRQDFCRLGDAEKAARYGTDSLGQCAGGLQRYLQRGSAELCPAGNYQRCGRRAL